MAQLQWLRWFNGTAKDPKMGSIARRARSTRPVVISVWAMLLEDANEREEEERGRITVDADGIGDMLQVETEEVERVLAEMTALGMIGQGRVTKFLDRNPARDDSAERMRRLRERRRQNANEPSPDANSGGQVTTPGDGGDVTVTNAIRHNDGGDGPREEKRREDLSVTPSGVTGATRRAERPPDPLKERVFGPILDDLVVRTGKTAAAIRPVLGRWCKDFGDEQVIAAAMKTDGAIDPLAYMGATLQGRAGGSRNGRSANLRGRTEEGDRADILAGLGLGPRDVEVRPAATGRVRDRPG